MELKPEQLVAQLDSGPLRPAYLIAGPETLRVLEAADALRVAARAQGYTEREVYEIEGNREPDWAAMEASFNAPSLFASRRLIELRLPTGKPGKEGAKVIEAFCAAPPGDVTLLVTGGEWSRQHGGKWSEAIGKLGQVAIDGTRHPVVGRVAMDQFIVDVGDAHVAVGDEVVLFGDPATGAPSADDWGDASDSIAYEIVTRIGARVPRTHLDAS